MIATRTPEEIAVMREGGQKLGVILQDLLLFARLGTSLIDIDRRADRLIQETGGAASFKTVKNYQWATCLCVNDVVVHGLPTEYKLRGDDALTIDVGMFYKGFHTDTAWTKIIQNSEKNTKFLQVGEDALWKAIAEARIGNRVSHISGAIQQTIEGAGYGIVRTLVGHGVGRELHEAPQIPGFLKSPVEASPELVPGMTIAIEVIYAMGKGAVSYANNDGWSIATKDRSLSAVFEHTVAITPSGPLILTEPEN